MSLVYTCTLCLAFQNDFPKGFNQNGDIHASKSKRRYLFYPFCIV